MGVQTPVCSSLGPGSERKREGGLGRRWQSGWGKVERKEGTGFERDFKVLLDQVVHWMGTEMKTSKASIDGSWVSGVQNWMDGNAIY